MSAPTGLHPLFARADTLMPSTPFGVTGKRRIASFQRENGFQRGKRGIGDDGLAEVNVEEVDGLD